jgi:glycosyltransferase involved in cell wall biosynthesis
VRAQVTPALHVAHLLSSLELGGQERVALDLAAGQVRAGHRVTAVSLAPAPDGRLAPEFRAAGAEVVRVERRRRGADPALVLRLSRWLEANRVDLVHTHNRMALLYGAPAGRLARIAVVHTKHGRNPSTALQLIAARLAARCVDAFVAVSPETAVFARGRREVAESRLSVIPNGIELDRFRPDPSARERLRLELGIPLEAWVVGTVGRIATEKNQALLLRAVAPLLDDRSRLVVAGDGPVLPALTALSTALGTAPFVHLLGARRDVPDLLNVLDVFALSSDSEGLPLVIPEAMATGLPVVSTRVGGVGNVLEEGQTGFMVPAGDEAGLRARLAALRADPALGRSCGVRARHAALARYSAERMLGDYLELYRRVLSNRTDRGSGRAPAGGLSAPRGPGPR